MGKALVSATIGAEGLPLVDREHFVNADTPSAFATAVVDLVRNPVKNARLGHSARKYVNDNYRWGEVVDDFLQICKMVSQ